MTLNLWIVKRERCGTEIRLFQNVIGHYFFVYYNRVYLFASGETRSFRLGFEPCLFFVRFVTTCLQSITFLV